MNTIQFFRSRALAATIVATVSVGANACTSVGILDGEFPDPGHVLAHVSDQNNAPVAGAVIQLLLPGTTLTWGSASTDASGNAAPGETDGGILPGGYDANVVPPTGYTVASGQQNPIPITVQSNKTINLTFKLTKGP